MAHTQYSLTQFYDQTPMEHLLYISSATYGKDWISMMHAHSFTELFYVVDGNGYFCTDSSKTPIQKDSLILINPNTKHTEKSSTSHPLTYIVLGIDNLRFEFHGRDYDVSQIYDIRKYRESILPIMQMMLGEVRQKNEGYEQVCQHFLCALLLRILRITGEKISLAGRNEISAECELIKNYIDEHYRDVITLDTLADVSHLNKFYLSHTFTDAYGIAPINYLLERRILHSKTLLKTTDYSVTLIAHMTGFSSANYFSQSFKKYTGVTPLAYRKKYTKYPM